MKNKLFYFTLIVALLFCKSIILGGSKVETFNLKNGIKVVYKQVEGRNLTALKLCSPVSIAYENTDKAGVTSLLYSVRPKAFLKTWQDIHIWKPLALNRKQNPSGQMILFG